MYPDDFFQLIDSFGVPWVLVGLAYALFNYSFDVVMCFWVGGIQKLRSLPVQLSFKRSKLGDSTRVAMTRFWDGGIALLQEFFTDNLSWLWPLTVVLIPTAVYGMSRHRLEETMLDLLGNGFLLENYRIRAIVLFGDDLQIVLWIMSLMVGFGTFLRYQRRSKATWFSRSIVFHLARILIFDSVLSYFVLNIIFSWLDFSTALFFLLRDDGIIYSFLNPDLLYGLKSAYDVVVLMSSLLIVFSFLPAVMLIREKQETYSWIYLRLLYGGVGLAILFGSLLAAQFDQRLEIIHQGLLESIYQSYHLNALDVTRDISTIIGLQYYRLASALPNSFPIPRWLEYLFSLRVLSLLYEVYKMLASPNNETTLFSILQKLMDAFS